LLKALVKRVNGQHAMRIVRFCGGDLAFLAFDVLAREVESGQDWLHPA
jgi:hypothetical protein